MLWTLFFTVVVLLSLHALASVTLRRLFPKVLFVLPLVLLASPAFADVFDLTLHYGFDTYGAVSLKHGLGGVGDSGRLRNASTDIGATAIVREGIGELGVIGELGRPGQDATTTLLGVLAGFGFNLGPFRLEALGELGAHRYGDVLADAALLNRSSADVWLVSVGVRPGISVRFGPSNALLLGLWACARWDVTSQDVQVSLAGFGNSTYTIGGSQYGAALRLGASI